jgi:archaellum component FlaD/FlaE
MQTPKIKLNILSKLSLNKIADRILGEKPPSAQEISAMIADSIQKSGAAAGAHGPAAGSGDYKTVLDEVKKEVQKDVNTRLTAFDTKAGDLEKHIKEARDISLENKAKLEAMEKSLKKFLALYELVTNQVNPFIETHQSNKHEGAIENQHATHMHSMNSQSGANVHPPEQTKEPKLTAEEKKIMSVVSSGPAYTESPQSHAGAEGGKIERHMIDIREINPAERKLVQIGEDGDVKLRREDVEISEIEQDKKIPLHIEPVMDYRPKGDINETLKNLLPLRSIKNDLCSLVTTLNWLRYLTEKAGTKGACDMLKSYTTLGWITPEVYTILVKYITGMGGQPLDTKIPEKRYNPTVDDHMKSLFFISKLKGIDLEKEEYDKIVKKLTFLEEDINGS